MTRVLFLLQYSVLLSTFGSNLPRHAPAQKACMTRLEIAANSVISLHRVAPKTEEYDYNDIQRQIAMLKESYPAVRVSPIGDSGGSLYRLDPEPPSFGFIDFRRVTPKPILAIDVLPTEAKRGQLVIVAGHHGTEPAGPLAALEFVDRYLRSETSLAATLRSSFQLTVIPVVDVDSYSEPLASRHYSMTNNFYHKLEERGPLWKDDGWGREPQRAFPETRSVAAAVANRSIGKFHRIAFDLHESAVSDAPPSVRDSEFFIFEKEEDAPLRQSAIQDSRDRIRSFGFETKRFLHTYARNISFEGFCQRQGYWSFTQESPRFGKSGQEVIDIRDRILMHLISIESVLTRLLPPTP